MIIPKGRVIHEDLSTSYTNIQELLRELRQNSFTGYCQVSFWEYRGTLFLDRGRIINGLEEIGTTESAGERAIKNILRRASEKDGTVSVFRLKDEMVATLASMLNSNVKYRDLTTELTSLEKLISKLKKEEHSGYVEVLLNSDGGHGCVYFQDGRAMESVFRSPDGDMISGPSGFKKILGLSTEVGAIFNVYDSDFSSIIVDNSLTDDVIQLFQKTLVILEDVIDTHAGPGKFLDEFKRVLASNANKYLFLDPFAGEFVYKNKQLRFDGDTTLNEFSNGVCDVITQAVEFFQAQEKSHTLSEAITTAIRQLKEEQVQLIDRLELKMKMPSVFGARANSNTEGDNETEDKKSKRSIWPFRRGKGKSEE